MTESGSGLFHLGLGGWFTQLTGVRVSSPAGPVSWHLHDGDAVPGSEVAQGETIYVTASATPAPWLRWLLGGEVTFRRTLRTPTPALATPVVLSSDPGRVLVKFTRPVSVVEYQPAGAPAQVVRLPRASEEAELAVPSPAPAGTLAVRAAAWPWERLAPEPSTVTWFSAPRPESLALAEPAPGAGDAAANGPITLTFDEPVSRLLGNSRPTVTPNVAGNWSERGRDTLVFTPTGFGFGPGTEVTVAFDRPVQVVGDGGRPGDTTASASSSYHFGVAPGSMLRLEQILAQLHYLPLTFVPANGEKLPTTFAAEVSTMTRPLAGRFSWRWPSTPAALESQWSVGTPNNLVRGALMAFEADQPGFDGYAADDVTVDQLAGASTWEALLQAAAAGKVDPNPYSYVYVTQSIPETLTLWQNGSVVLTSPANTGIPERPTADGTYPIYVRYTFAYMSGFNPDGSYYHDPVYWINYFNGGDAVHGFPRAYYGYPQSLGCVELPISTAAVAFDDLAIGDLVTVAD